MGGVDGVVADAEAGDDLELRKRVDEGGVDPGRGCDAAHGAGKLGGDQSGVGPVDGDLVELFLDALADMGMNSSGNQDPGTLAGAHD